MKAYLYQAALLCFACGEAVKETVRAPEGVDPANPNECLYDSDDWPKGPYSYGGGEADTPQHCDHCGVFLENALTDDGVKYVQDAAEKYISPDDEGQDWAMVADRAEDDGKNVVAEWVRFYFAPGQ